MKKFIIILIITSLALSPLCAKTKKSKKNSKTSQTAETETLLPPGYEEPVIPKGDTFEIDNFEQGLYWQKSGFEGFSETNCSLDTKWANPGKYSLKCDYVTLKKKTEGSDAAGEQKTEENHIPEKEAAFLCSNLIERNFTGAKYIIFNVNNPSKECIYLSTGAQCRTEAAETEKQNLVLNKSKYLICPPGQHLMVFNIEDFKNIEDVYSIIIFADTSTTLNAKSASFNIDNVRIVFSVPEEEKPASETPAASETKPASETAVPAEISAPGKTEPESEIQTASEQTEPDSKMKSDAQENQSI